MCERKMRGIQGILLEIAAWQTVERGLEEDESVEASLGGSGSGQENYTTRKCEGEKHNK